MNVPFFSVVVCTYNREVFLKKCITNLLDQDYDSRQFEILVVDNGSTDLTQKMIENDFGAINNLTYFKEKTIGLSFARNKGYKEAKGRYIVYTDDDCEIPSSWLSNAAALLSKKNYFLLGGPVYPFYISSKPAWYKNSYSDLTFGDSDRVLNNDEYLFGGNLFIKSELLQQFNGFDTNLGMSGNIIGYSEETDLQIRIRKNIMDIEIFYSPTVYVKHVVRPEKLKFRWIFNSWYKKGIDNFKLALKNNTVDLSKRKYIESCCWFCYSVMEGSILQKFRCVSVST
jgi:glycosyltransferase involved in cell wall biosynthesis